MNTPQLENGYTRIANEILAALSCAGLTGMELQIVLVILRKTYGYGKKEDWISLSQFVQLTGRTKKGICVAIAALEEKKIVHTRRVTQKTFYSFNKNHASWKVVYPSTLVNASTLPRKKAKLVNPSTPPPVYAGTPHPVYASTHTKENVTKENVTKETPTVAKAFIFSPSNFMPDFVVMPSDDGHGDKPPKKKQPFNYQDYAELTRLMKKVCGFTTLHNGTKPQDNYARHILMFLLKVLKEKDWPEQEAIDQIRFNMDEFCQIVQAARDADKFLHSKLTSLQEIYFELKRGRIFEAAKSRSPKPFTTVSL